MAGPGWKKTRERLPERGGSRARRQSLCPQFPGGLGQALPFYQPVDPRGDGPGVVAAIPLGFTFFFLI